jgi:uncharacterized protein YccT (UPF0319 family)
MRDRKKRTLSQAEKRALASAGLTVTRYNAGGERAAVTQLAPESDERRRSHAMRLTNQDDVNEASKGASR